MYTFYDLNGHEVRLTFADQPPIKDAKHVLIICLYNNQWVLTKHKKRGYEFPGGKVEAGRL